MTAPRLFALIFFKLPRFIFNPFNLIGKVRKKREILNTKNIQTKMKSEVTLKIISNQNKIETCTLFFSTQEPWCLEYQGSLGKKYSFEDTDLFNCLCSLRVLLEKQNKYILCHGARLNAFPSGMARDMIGARKIYLLKMGKQARGEDMVDLFGETTLDQVSTVAEQKNYYEKWINSILQRK